MTALVKTSKAIKDSTSTGRMVIDAVERARELYLAQIKRAEAELFERIRRATDIIAGGEEPAEPAAPKTNNAEAPTPAA